MIDLTPTDAQRDLTAGVRDLLTGHAGDASAPLPASPALWSGLSELGVFGLPVPESAGGLGLGVVESALVFAELGRAVAPGPLLWTQLAAITAPDLLERPVVVAGIERTPGPLVVEHLAGSDHLLVLDDAQVTLVDSAAVASRPAVHDLDPLTPTALVDELPPGRVVGDAVMAQRLRRVGTLLSAAFLLGLAERAVDVATEYAKGRTQFDRPIGSFQAVKHLLADAFVRGGLARASVYAAAVLVESGSDRDSAEVASELAAAKLLAGEAADRNARTAIQVFGGMGFTSETLPHYLLKRAWVLESSFGTRDDQALAISALLTEEVGA